MKHQSGFTIVEILLVAVFLALVGLLSYNFVTKINPAPDNESPVASSSDVVVAPRINEHSDLDKALETLDRVNLDDSNDLSQLENDLSAF